MPNSNSSDADLLKSVLEPLLEDFQYWFARSQQLLETEEIPFLEVEQQADLLARVVAAQQEVTAAQTLFRATGGQVGVEASIMAPWHQLVTECWRVSIRFRQAESAEKGM